MRFRIPRLPVPERAAPKAVVPVAAHDPARWSVPFGVRTASEWAWRLIIIGALIWFTLKALASVSEVVIPIIVALLLAALLNPVKRVLQRFMPSGLATGITVFGTLGVLVGMFSFVGNQLSSQMGDLTQNVTKGLAQIRDWLTATFHVNDKQITDYLEKARAELAGSGLGTKAAEAGLTATHVIAGFFIAMFTLFFFLNDGHAIWKWIVSLFPRAARERVHSSGLIAWDQISAFTRATILVAAVDAIGIGVGAALLGVPFASGIGLLVFFGAFVPVVGAAVSGGVAVLLALVAKSPMIALAMLGVVVGVQQLESHILQPFLIGRAMKVHPLAIILGIAAGVIVAGIVGALIAVPVVAVLNAVGHHLLDEPEPPEPEPDPGDVAVGVDPAVTGEAETA